MKTKSKKSQKFKNIYIDYSSNFEKYKVDEFHNIECIIDPMDKSRSEYYIKQEGAYYNSIVSGLSPFIRNSPDKLKIIKEKYIDLYSAIASTGFKLSQCMYKKIDLPNNLLQYEDIIYGTENKKRQITPDIAFIMDVAASPSNIISYVRENISKEILIHIVSQIEKISISSMGEDGEIVYQKPMEILEPVDPYYRNTLQLTKNCMRISYNNLYNCSVIRSQYFVKPLIVENINLVENKNWNILTLKYNYCNNNKLWSITTKKTNGDYILRTSTIKRVR